jgi:hypothetical protein
MYKILGIFISVFILSIYASMVSNETAFIGLCILVAGFMASGDD